MPAFKDADEALSHLKDVKAVALGQMTHLTIRPEDATALYAKYWKTIDMLIGLGDRFAGNREALQQYAQALEKYTPNILERGSLNVGGKTLAVFGSIGMVLTGGLIADWRDIREAWSGPAETNKDIIAASKKVQTGIVAFETAFNDAYSSYTALVNGMVCGDEAKVEKAYARLSESLAALEKAYTALDASVKELGIKSTYFDGAMGVLRDFVLQAGITVATMGATEIGIHLVGKVATKFAPSVVEYATEHSRAIAGAIAGARNAPKVIKTAKGVYTTGKGVYEGAHGIENLGERLEEDHQFAKEHAP